MPQNFLHVGLIHLMFPNSKIIHVKRNPIDTCFSCYFQNFETGHGYSFNLTTLGKYYLAYQKLMQHWNNILPGKIFELDYENLVTQQETTIREMFDYLNINWHENCIAHHKNSRVPDTASHWQACQPTYDTSIQRWRNYQPYITDLLNELNWKN